MIILTHVCFILVDKKNGNTKNKRLSTDNIILL